MEKPVYWHQGLFLQPQHFQLDNLFHQSLLTPYQKHLQPHFWGVENIEISETALGNYSFTINQGRFLFPDMTYVDYPANAMLKPRSFESDWLDASRPLGVYIGLKKYDRQDKNVGVLTEHSNAEASHFRFVTSADPEMMKDTHEDGPDAEIRQLTYHLKIFWDHELDQLGEYLLIPVGQCRRSGDDILLSDAFIPPVLGISASTPLMYLIKDIFDLLASRGNQLEAHKGERGVHSAEFGSRDMTYLLVLMALNRHIPMLNHFYESPTVHPWMVYAALRQIVGELSSFSSTINVFGQSTESGLSLLPYDHRDLWGCFNTIRQLILKLIDDITAGPDHIISLIFDGTYFASDLKEELFQGDKRYYLAVETEMDAKNLVPDIQTNVKTCSRERLPLLIARALPGVPLEYMINPPQELPRRANTFYFQIDHHSDHWGLINKGLNIAMYWDNAPENVRMELMVAGGG